MKSAAGSRRGGADPGRAHGSAPAPPPRLEEAEQTGLSLLVPALLLGVAVGIVGGAFRLGLDGVGSARRWAVDAAAHAGLPGWAVSLLLSAVGVTFAVWLVRRVAPEAAGSGIQEVEGALDGALPLRWRRVIAVKFVGGLVAIGAGLIAGREGPTVHMGGALGRMFGELSRRSPLDTHVLVAAGAGAGLTAAFNTPFAGVLFVMEEMRPHFRYSVRSMHALIAACVVADVVIRWMIGSRPEIASISSPAPPLGSLWLFVVFGSLFGALGPLFNSLVTRVLDLAARAPSPLLPALLIGGGVGLLDRLDPAYTGGGYDVIAGALRAEFAVGMLLVLFAARYAGTALCYGTGAPGGIFAPMLALGTLLGLWFGDFVGTWLPGITTDRDVFAVAGMGALFAAVVRAPLTGIALAVSLTANWNHVLPVLTTCLAASVVSYRIGGQPIYSLLLERTLRSRGGA